MLSLVIYFYVCWGTRSLPSQMPDVLLTIALILGLYDHLKERIPTLNSFLGMTVTSLCVSLTMEHSIRFILRRQ